MNANILDQKLMALRKQEQEVRKQLINHLREIHRRELWKKLGYKSITEFCKKTLPYDEFQRREILIEIGAIITNAQMKDSDPRVQKRIESLKAWRKAKAAKADIAPFIIFSNKTLMVLAKEKPKTIKDLNDIPRLGPKRIELYGKEILRCLES